MPIASVALATVGVLSVILGILFQNGNLIKVWHGLRYTYIQTVSPSPPLIDIRNTSYQFPFQKALDQRLENMQKYDFPHDLQGVDRRSALSLAEFVDVYDGKWPVLITDVVPKWKAFNWTAEFFMEHYGDDRVTMRAVDGSLKDGRGLSLPLSLFLQNLDKSHPSMWTYLEDELFVATRPSLRAHIGPCLYLEEDFFGLLPESVVPWSSMILWGTAFSRSTLHIDPYNWTGTNAVISGNKRWKLFPPGQDQLLYVSPDKYCGFPLECHKYNSEVDSFAVDESRYPLFSQARFIEFDQKPGELLIIPTGWFHQAYNTEVTLAVSSQMMNSQNFHVVLEEMIKADNVKRSDLPLDIARLSPKQQVEAVMSLLSAEVLARGKAVTQRMLKDIEQEQRP